MLVSINSFLNRCQIMLRQTVYQEESREILEYPMILGVFLSFEKRGGEYEQFHFTRKIQKKIEERMAVDERLSYLRKEIETSETMIQMIKNSKNQMLNGRLKEVRKSKRAAQSLYNGRLYNIEKQCIVEVMGKEKKFSHEIIWYKKTAYLTTIRNLSLSVPALRMIQNNQLNEIPLFSANMNLIEHALHQKRLIAVEGGPCLFGNDEVIIEVTHQDNNVYFIDFAGPRYFEDDKTASADLDAHVRHHAKEIANIRFINKKKSITRGEQNAILHVFAIANVLKARAVIPIVDMSYRKYMSNALKNLDESLRFRVEQEFQKIVYGISDLFLTLIDQVKEAYPNVQVEVLHERNRGLCEMFEEKRQPWLNRYKKLDEITTNDARRQSIIDYVTMPALPFYRWGICDILQVDCISEIDSFRRCRNIHNNDINLSGIFYTEQVSLDKVHSDYSAKHEYKDYIGIIS